MFKAKTASKLAIACILAASLNAGAVIAFAEDSVSSATAANQEKIKNEIKDARPAQREMTLDELKAIAEKLGINTEGMTEEQIKSALTEYKQNFARQEKALDSGDLPAKEFKAKKEMPAAQERVKDRESGKANAELSAEDLKAMAEKLGINTEGMTDEQIKAALIEFKSSNRPDIKRGIEKSAISGSI